MSRHDAAKVERGETDQIREGEAPPLVGVFDRVKRLFRRRGRG
jgi:hypothetical protein